MPKKHCKVCEKKTQHRSIGNNDSICIPCSEKVNNLFSITNLIGIENLESDERPIEED